MSHKNRFLQPQNNLPAVRKTESLFYSGPLPPAQELQKYNDILPGAADRIIIMAEEQAKHRRSLENTVITSDTKNATLGLIFGLIIGLAGIISGTVIIIYGYAIYGVVVGGGTIASLVATFVYGSRQRKIERERKLQG